MKVVNQILMVVSAIALIIAVLMGVNIIQSDIMNVSGRGFLELSIACSLWAIGSQVVKPFGGGGSEG